MMYIPSLFGCFQVWLTAVMLDLCHVFKNLQQKLQKSNIMILDVMTARETALRELHLMKEGPIAGGNEEKFAFEDERNEVRKSRANHCYVDGRSRSLSAIRYEVLLSAINFLGERLQIEDDGTVTKIQAILAAKSPKEIIDASREFVCEVFGESKVREFSSDVCKSFGNIECIKDIESTDEGTVLALRLRKMIDVSYGYLKMLLGAFLVVTPHSMATERVVSHYNRVKTYDRSSLKQSTINNILHISLNGSGTSFFDPREAVAEFLKRKTRRNSTPDAKLFKDREYMKKFF